jgi:CheY-like chemotaxis protein
MGKEVQARLFEPFFTTKPLGHGTGMGLASVRGTVQAHGGAIGVTSEEGRGSCFRLYLPLARDSATGTFLTPLEVPRLRRLHVLLVEDEPLVREQVQRSLLALGHEVESAGGGREALRLFETGARPFDVVLLDVVMADLGGRDTFRALRRLRPEQRVLVTSGFALDGEVQVLLDEGANAFLPKPFLRAQLVRALVAALT